MHNFALETRVARHHCICGNKRTFGYFRWSSQHGHTRMSYSCMYSFGYQAKCSVVTTALFANWCFGVEVSQFGSEYEIFLRPITIAQGVSAIKLFSLSDIHYHQHKVDHIEKCARAASMGTHAYHVRVCMYSFAHQANCSIVTTVSFANWCFSEEVSHFNSEYPILLRPVATAPGVSAIIRIFPVWQPLPPTQGKPHRGMQ